MGRLSRQEPFQVEAGIVARRMAYAHGGMGKKPLREISTKSEFGIFDVVPGDSARDAHLTGQVAMALMAKAPELFAQAPAIEKLEALASKIP